MFNPVILIPCFNHADALASVASRIADLSIPVIIIDDGSTQTQSDKIRTICANNNYTYIHQTPNAGKGAAMITGFRAAHDMGFSHALQIDADGQHDISDIPKFLSTAHQHPTALITGAPIYDSSAPKSRLIGRKITDFWVAIETLNRHMPDSMCGFRVYPLSATSKILRTLKFKRMGFDIEILVKLFRTGTPIIPISTKVIYPPCGISHFRVWRDNFYISLLHTYLFITIPTWLITKAFKKCTKQSN